MLLSLVLASIVGPVQDVAPVHQRVRTTDVARLPGGDLLVARSDGFIVAVDPATGEPSTRGAARAARLYPDVFATHPTAVYDLVLDPSGKLVAATSLAGRVSLWRVKTDHNGAFGYPGRYRDPEVVLNARPQIWRGSSGVAWSHDGEHLLTWTSPSRPERTGRTAMQLWSRAGEVVWTGPHVRWAAISPTLDLMAFVGHDGVHLFWPGEHDTILRLEGACHAAFSPDGSRLAVGGMGSHLWIIDVDSAGVLLDAALDVGDPFQENKFPTCMRWSPDGKWLGMTLGKGLIPVVIDPLDGRTVWSGGFHGGRMWAVFPVAWTPDNRLFYSWDGTYLVEPASGKKTVIAEDECAVFAPAGESAIFLVTDALERIELATLQRTWRK